jgi:hypothetical protein
VSPHEWDQVVKWLAGQGFKVVAIDQANGLITIQIDG